MQISNNFFSPIQHRLLFVFCLVYHLLHILYMFYVIHVLCYFQHYKRYINVTMQQEKMLLSFHHHKHLWPIRRLCHQYLLGGDLNVGVVCQDLNVGPAVGAWYPIYSGNVLLCPHFPLKWILYSHWWVTHSDQILMAYPTNMTLKGYFQVLYR